MAITEFYTLSLHDALPISVGVDAQWADDRAGTEVEVGGEHSRRAAHTVEAVDRDRKSTRLNSSHRCISYAVFCLKKKTSYVFQVLRCASSLCCSILLF